jgi:pantetheine-phosphate adenylyltransferase
MADSMAEPAQHHVIGVYPGSFDPPTLGHLDIAIRGARIVDELIVAIYAHPTKNLLFEAEERGQLWRDSLIALDAPTNIRIMMYEGLTTTLAQSIGATLIIRGLRTVADFEVEFQQAHMYRHLDPKVDVLMLMTDLEHMYISASLVKEVARLGAPVDSFVTVPVAKAIYAKLKRT